MKAHIIENGIVVNTIEVESLDFMPNLVEATQGSIGWNYSDGVFSIPASLNEQEAKSVREQRNYLLINSDWTQVTDSTANKEVWATYRQALRDITSQEGFPHEVTWPQRPE